MLFSFQSLLALLTILSCLHVQSLAAPIDLGTAKPFGIVATSMISNTGNSNVDGELGLFPNDAGSITGFAPGDSGVVHAGDGVADQAHQDAQTAYNAAAGLAATADKTGQDLGGQTLVAGVYHFSSSVGITGPLTLNAQGDPNAQFVFQIGTTLTTASASSVVLINGAQACNVFWQVGSSATLGTTTVFAGNILASASINVNNGVVIDGGLYALTAAVTLINDQITAESCLLQTSSAAPIVASTPAASDTPASTPTTSDAATSDTPAPIAASSAPAGGGAGGAAGGGGGAPAGPTSTPATTTAAGGAGGGAGTGGGGAGNAGGGAGTGGGGAGNGGAGNIGAGNGGAGNGGAGNGGAGNGGAGNGGAGNGGAGNGGAGNGGAGNGGAGNGGAGNGGAGNGGAGNVGAGNGGAGNGGAGNGGAGNGGAGNGGAGAITSQRTTSSQATSSLTTSSASNSSVITSSLSTFSLVTSTRSNSSSVSITSPSASSMSTLSISSSMLNSSLSAASSEMAREGANSREVVGVQSTTSSGTAASSTKMATTSTASSSEQVMSALSSQGSQTSSAITTRALNAKLVFGNFSRASTTLGYSQAGSLTNSANSHEITSGATLEIAEVLQDCYTSAGHPSLRYKVTTYESSGKEVTSTITIPCSTSTYFEATCTCTKTTIFPVSAIGTVTQQIDVAQETGTVTTINGIACTATTYYEEACTCTQTAFVPIKSLLAQQGGAVGGETVTQTVEGTCGPGSTVTVTAGGECAAMTNTQTVHAMYACMSACISPYMPTVTESVTATEMCSATPRYRM